MGPSLGILQIEVVLVYPAVFGLQVPLVAGPGRRHDAGRLARFDDHQSPPTPTAASTAPRKRRVQLVEWVRPQRNEFREQFLAGQCAAAFLAQETAALFGGARLHRSEEHTSE